MNIFTRIGDKHDKREKKSPAVKAASTEPIPRSPELNLRRGNQKVAGTKPGPDLDHEIDGENDNTPQLQSGKRRTVSISRSGRYKSKKQSRGRVLSDEVFSETKGAVAAPVPASSPVVSVAPADLVKPTGAGRSPARPYIILKSDSSVAFAIESTSL